MARAGITWKEEDKTKHWLAFWRNPKDQTWQGLRIAIMERNNELWKKVITDNGTETDQMVIQFRLWDLFGDIGTNILESITVKSMKAQTIKINNKETHNGMGIQYKNTWLGGYYPLPIVRMRYANDSRIVWAIPRGIPEYHNRENVPTPKYRMSVNFSGIVNDQEEMSVDRSLWTVYYFEGKKTFVYAGWAYLNTTIDSNLRRMDINQGINRMLAYEVTSYKPIYIWIAKLFMMKRIKGDACLLTHSIGQWLDCNMLKKIQDTDNGLPKTGNT